jgi:hypothetical protein
MIHNNGEDFTGRKKWAIHGYKMDTRCVFQLFAIIGFDAVSIQTYMHL